MKSIFRLLPVVLLLVGCLTDSIDETPADDDAEVVRVGDDVPVLSVDVIDGDSHSLFTTREMHEPAIIVFFNTACSDCQRELPVLNAYYLKHRDEPGFRMVAIAREEEEESIAAYWKDHQLVIPYSPQPDRRVYNLFARLTIPRVYFCSAEGVITRIDIEKLDHSLYQ